MTAATNEIWDHLDDLLEQYDAAFTCEVATGCAWSGELRLVLTNPDRQPSRSMTFYKAGGADPEDIAQKVYADAVHWMRETGTEPMPVPDWLKD